MRPTAMLLALLVPLAAAAAEKNADAVRPLRVEIVPNFHTASVYAFYDGDADADAACRLQYRTDADGEWREGHPLVRNGHTKTFPETGRFAGSLFGLVGGWLLEVRVTFEDPDGLADGAPRTLTATSCTRSAAFPTGSGKTYYVEPNGNDEGPGTREKPFATIQHAVDRAEPSDTILLAPNAFRESVTVTRSGRPDACIRLQGTEEDREVTGAGGRAVGLTRETRLRGDVTPDGPGEHLGGNLWVLQEPRRVGTLTRGRTRWYHHGSLEELKEAESPLVPGWWQDEKAGKVYLRMDKEEAPPWQALCLGVLPFGLKFENASYWIVENIDFEVFGGGPYSRGIEVRGGESIVIRGCDFHCMRTGVRLAKGSRRCLVERCTFRDNSIWNWPWKACKSHDVEGCAVSLQGGSGNVVRHNHIEGLFNGIAPATWGDLHNDRINCDMDVHHNTFTHVADDCLEPEGSCINVRFWNNRAFDVFMGISIAPVTVGPCWVVRDRYEHFKQGGLKVGIDTAGVAYVYHTLFWQDHPDRNATGICGAWGNMHFRNCIFRGTKYAIEDNRDHPAPCSFDYCCLYAVRGTPFVKWEGKRYSRLEELPREKGFGPHNLRDRPYTRAKDHRPMVLAPALIDAGVRLPGINDRFKGDAPDIGPEEVR